MSGIDTGTGDVSGDGVLETDVLVVGGGPAGCLAALSARNNGAEVLLVEREQYLGGAMTGGMVNSLEGYRSLAEGHPIVVEGIAIQVFETLLEREGTQPGDGDELAPGFPGQYTDPTMMIHVLDEMMREANVDVLFDTFAFDAIVEDGAIAGIVVANKSGRQVIRADQVVDCTGDADVAAAAGVPYEHGREEDARVHGGSMLMVVCDIDLDRLIDYMSAATSISPEELDEIQASRRRLIGGGGKPNVSLTRDGEEIPGYGPMQPIDWQQVEKNREAGMPFSFQARAGPTGMGATYEYEEEVPPEAKYIREWIDYIKAGKVPQWLGAKEDVYPPPPSLGILGFGMFKHGRRRYDTMLTGAYEAFFDQTDVTSISEATMYMRELNQCYMRFLRGRIPGFEDAYIMYEAPSIGTRESRRIVGEYVLTADDQATGCDFSDVIAKSGRSPSTHSVTGEWGTFIRGELASPFDIPYRSLVPKRIEDLLVGGRSISITHEALGGVRFQVICMATGEAAGAAAALASRLDVHPRELNVQLLQKRLLEQNVKLFMDDELPEREAEVDAIEAAKPLEDHLTS